MADKRNGMGDILGSCLIEHCPNLRRKRSPLCRCCAASFNYWGKKGPKAVLDRQNQLEKWQDRIQYMSSEERRFKNVAKHIQKRRA